MSSDRKDHEMKHVFSRADHQTNTENICEKPNMKRVRKKITRKNIKSTESYLKDLKLKKKLIYIYIYIYIYISQNVWQKLFIYWNVCSANYSMLEIQKLLLT